MEKLMCLATMAISGLVLLAFALDLALKIPFGGLSTSVDVLTVVGAGLVGYLGWESFREQR